MPEVRTLTKLNHAFVRLMSLSFAASVVVLSIIVGSPLIFFLDPTTLLLVWGGPVCLLMWIYGAQTLSNIVRLIQGMLWPPGAQAFDEHNLEDGVDVAQSAQRLTMFAGWVGVIIGSVQILRAPDPFSSPLLGVVISLALLSLFYAVVTNMMLWFPLERYCTLALKRGAEAPPFKLTPPPPMTKKNQIALTLAILVALILGGFWGWYITAIFN